MTRPRRKPEDETPSGSTLDGPDPVGPKTIRAISDLLPDHANANRGTQRGGLMLRASIERNGAGRSVLADRNGRLIAGNKTVEAALDARLPVRVVQTDGSELVVVQRTDLDLTDPRGKARQLAFADNRVGEVNLDWSPDAIKDAFAAGALEDLDYLFDDAELNRIVGEALVSDTSGIDDSPYDGDPEDAPKPSADPISKLGDVWVLGRHRVMCGDSTAVTDVDALMGGVQADCVWTDPPYGVSYVGGTADALNIKNDDLNEDGLTDFLRSSLGVAFACSKDGSVWYVAAPSSTLFHCFGAVLKELGVWRHTLAWVKSAFVLGRCDYHYQHESIFYGWKPGAAHKWRSDRKQSSTLHFDKPTRNDVHPTMKPVDLVEYCIGNSTDPNDVVMDLFGGSGTTLIACEKSGRVARLMELDPRYCDVIVKRWQKFTGKSATLEATGQPFGEKE